VNQIKTVLNVDDHAPARFARTRILQRAGFGVDEVDNAAQALERAPSSSLLLLDVKLPDGDGFNVCEQVKQIAPQLPVVMVTSVYRTSQARREAFAAGADAFLQEPVPEDQLIRTVESLINRQPDPRAALSGGWITTDALGDILSLSDEAATLLNLSVRGARGRNLPGFFTDNRSRLVADLLRVSHGVIVDRVSTLQPRDRRPRRVHIEVSVLPCAPGDRARLHWIL
jgi:CheY-like chemotaxis protein